MTGPRMDYLEAAVLVAVARGVNTPGRIADLLNVEEEAVAKVLDDLEARGLVKRERRGLLLKRTVYVLTEEGARRLGEAMEALKRAAEALERAAKRGERVEEEGLVGLPDLGFLLPFLLWLGLIDAAAAQALMVEELEEALESGGYEDVELGDLGGEDVA